MQRSDIFESFIKIAQDKGLISDEPKDKRSKQSKTDPASVAKLYGVEPDAPKDAQYKRNIIEKAHPDSVVISPSYDKLNGLVENNNERQDIILNILKKNPNGHLTAKKYAEQDLVLALVSLGNHLDNTNNDELRILADECLLQTSSIKKQALAPAAIVGLVGGIAVTVGLIYLHQHMNYANEGFIANTNKIIQEVDDLLNSNTNLGVGYEYNIEFLNTMKMFRQKITEFGLEYNKIVPIITSLDMPRTGKELKEMASKPETTTVINAYKEFRAAASDLLPFIAKVVEDLSSSEYKNRAIKEKGVFTSLLDKTRVLHGGKGLVADDFDDVVQAIAPYKESIIELMDKLKTADSLEASAAKQIQASQFESTQSFDKPEVKPETKSKSIDEQLSELDKHLSGGL